MRTGQLDRFHDMVAEVRAVAVDKGEDLLGHLQEVVDVVDGILHPVDTAALENYKILEVMPDCMISDRKKGSEMPD